MRISPSVVRFLLEAGFLILVAAAAGIARLSWPAIVLVMGVAWALTALVERTAARHTPPERAPAESAPRPVPSATEHTVVEAAPAPAEPQAAPPPPPPPAPAESPSAPAEPPPASEPVPAAGHDWPARPDLVTAGEPAVEARAPQAAPSPAPAPSAEAAPVDAPTDVTPAEPAPAGAAVDGEAPAQEVAEEASGAVVEEPEAPAEPREPAPIVAAVPEAPAPPAPEPPPVHEQVVPFGPVNGPREWNLWDLERLAREREGLDAAQDEEWTFTLMHLRQFANADGILPVTFDPLVRESFADLLPRARR